VGISGMFYFVDFLYEEHQVSQCIVVLQHPWAQLPFSNCLSHRCFRTSKEIASSGFLCPLLAVFPSFAHTHTHTHIL